MPNMFETWIYGRETTRHYQIEQSRGGNLRKVLMAPLARPHLSKLGSRKAAMQLTSIGFD